MTNSCYVLANGMQTNELKCIFWPDLEACVWQNRAQYQVSNEKHRKPLRTPARAKFCFQQSVIDIFNLQGRNPILYTYRYAGWVERDPNVILEAHGCMGHTRNLVLYIWFTWLTFFSDREALFDSHEYNPFFKNWGKQERISSAYYLQNNDWGEPAVKRPSVYSQTKWMPMFGCIIIEQLYSRNSLV